MKSIRIFRHHVPAHFVWLALFEFFGFAIAVWIGAEIRFWDAPNSYAEIQPILPKALAFSAAIVGSIGGFGLYERQPNLARRAIMIRVAGAFAFSLVPLALIFYVFPGIYLGRGAVALGLVISVVVSFGLRFIFYKILRQESLKRRVLVLGTGHRAKEIQDYVYGNWRSGISIVGFVRVPPKQETEVDRRIMVLNGNFAEVVRGLDVQEIVVAMDDRRGGLPVEQILACRMSGVMVLDYLSFFERETGEVRLDYVTPGWFIFSDGFEESFTRNVSKRLVDWLVVLALAPLAVPIGVLIALGIKLEEGLHAPIFYVQDRVGRAGAHFPIFKFRSMAVASAASDNGAQWASQGDPRITRVGKIIRKVRLDELPQLLNILRGEMSIVGPRPEQPEFVEQLSEKFPYYRERHRIKPGLTGWAQISYQYGDSEEDAYRKLQYDLYYAKNHSLFLDLWIVLQTIEVVLLGKGAH